MINKEKLSNGHWTANLSNSSTRQKFAIFGEFEYSPEICYFWRIRVLAKMALFENRSDSPDSSTFANLVCSDSQDSLTFANLVCSDLQDLPKASLASFT
jgi:hypothetical protein